MANTGLAGANTLAPPRPAVVLSKPAVTNIHQSSDVGGVGTGGANGNGDGANDETHATEGDAKPSESGAKPSEGSAYDATGGAKARLAGLFGAANRIYGNAKVSATPKGELLYLRLRAYDKD